MDRKLDTVQCNPESLQMFTTDLQKQLHRGQEVVVDIAASEKAGENS